MIGSYMLRTGLILYFTSKEMYVVTHRHILCNLNNKANIYVVENAALVQKYHYAFWHNVPKAPFCYQGNDIAMALELLTGNSYIEYTR
ncbi:hypothetical protein J0S82_008485, partial [Galemys pyrenaicus]